LLDMFYRDPKRWAFTFQTYAFLSRTQAAVQQLRAGDAAYYAAAESTDDSSASATGDGERIPPSYVFERSLYSDKHCFATNCFKTGLFNQAEWTVYNDYHAFIMVCIHLLVVAAALLLCFRCRHLIIFLFTFECDFRLVYILSQIRMKTRACALTVSCTFVLRQRRALTGASAAVAPRKLACLCLTSANCTRATKNGSFRLLLLPRRRRRLLQHHLRPQVVLKKRLGTVKQQQQ